VTEQLDESVPGIAASSYPADVALLAELRAAWPPAPARSDAPAGYVTVDVRDRPPTAALRLGARHAIALVPVDDTDGAFHVAPLARDEVLITAWRVAVAGDGLSALVAGVPMASERPLGVDQTNASVVVGERAIVKWFRRVGPGPSRAATLIAHLDAVGFGEMPAPLGSLAWQRTDGPALTIAQGDAFLPGARDGWDWCLERVERHVGHGPEPCPAACDPWIGARLGRLVARLHAALARPSTVIPDPAGLAGLDDQGRWAAAALATVEGALALGAAETDSLADLGPVLRRSVAAADRPAGIAIQPVHGDLHVGQILEWPGGLAVIDFDGNPALDPAANALRQPVERDLAQMLSSLDHLGRVVAARHRAPAARIIDDWIARTRADFLAALDLPPDPELLAAFEVEQECRELVYAARFLPRWRYAPVATLRARYGA
jgi:maltokinase